MIFIKYISIILVFFITFLIGYLISKKYSNRVTELKELQQALNILENKIKFTYEPLKDIFHQMKDMVKGNISDLFNEISISSDRINIETAFEESLKNTKTNLEKEDIEILKSLSKILGKTEKEGQVSQIELTQTFLKTQINKAENVDERYS